MVLVLPFAGGSKALHTASIVSAMRVKVIMLLTDYGVIEPLNEDPGAVPTLTASNAPEGTNPERELYT